MFHKEDDTLDLLGQYTKRNASIKATPLEKEKSRPNHNYRSGKITTQENEKILYIKPLIFACSALLIIFIYFTSTNKNPIIGKWKSVNTSPIFGNYEIEFTEKRMFAFGMVGDVRYEEDGNKIIVFDKNGIFKDIGNVYIMRDKFTIENSSFGVKTIYKKIE